MAEKIKIMNVIGTRPEAIKLAPVILELKKHPDVDSIVCLTAQHREMLDQVLGIFDIHADIDLNLMHEEQTLPNLTASILTRMNRILEDRKPDWVLVQGDTTTVMATALAAYYQQIKVGHVEAGLRSHNKWAPYPEEINRKIAGILADLNFAPTENARRNLLNEGIPAEICHVTGNTVIDTLQMAAQMPFDLSQTALAKIPFEGKQILTVTAHRRENHGKPLKDICSTLLKISQDYAERVHIVFPVHLNPQVRMPVFEILGDKPNITLLDPLDYLSMVHLLKKTHILLTDSGGLQEEAPGLGIPVLVMRDVTERPEGVESGNVRLTGADPRRIYEQVHLLLDNSLEWEKMSHAKNPYGDGKAAKRIVNIIREFV